MISNRTWQGDWIGRESTEWKGPIKDLLKKIPTFTREEFCIGKGVNKYKDLIVREPLSDTTMDLGYVEATTEEQIPIDAVSNNFTGRSFRNRKQGYKLVQHHKVIKDVLEELDKHTSHSDQVIAEFLKATLRISIYGARMHIDFFVPHYKREIYTLKITCQNSVDKSLALTINLSLHSEAVAQELPFDGFHHVHTQELDDHDIRYFISNALERFLHGTWNTDSVDKDSIGDIIDDILTEKDKTKIRDKLNKEKDNRVNLLRFREILASLIDEGSSIFREQKLVTFAKLTSKLNQLADETEHVR